MGHLALFLANPLDDICHGGVIDRPNPLFPRFHGGPYASSYNPIYPEKDNLTSLWYFLLRFIPRSLPGNTLLPSSVLYPDHIGLCVLSILHYHRLTSERIGRQSGF